MPVRRRQAQGLASRPSLLGSSPVPGWPAECRPPPSPVSITTREPSCAYAQTHPDRQLRRCRSAQGSPGTHEAGQGRVGFSDGNARWLCTHAIRPGVGRTNQGRARLLRNGDSLATQGGREGMRDEGLLESALMRPQNLAAYADAGQPPDTAALAASYGVGIAKNHPFVDGNKRAAFLAFGLFLYLNGFRLQADQADATLTMLAVAAGDIPEDAFASWLRAHLAPRPQ